MALEQKEIKKAYIRKEGDDYSAMQGPAPDGFHVPLRAEWDAVKGIRTALGGGSSDGTNFGIALKLPFAGYRSYTDSNVSHQSSDGHYCSVSYNISSLCFHLSLAYNLISTGMNETITTGYSIRCFRNYPIVPTSSWTKLYGTSIEAGGIFWSSADGLISMSSDGQTWITIQDKNLGATTVWNSGDTLSEANCGKYYQRGNNYGFPRTGSVTTSSTQVNAQNYGPGNYYSGSTFIVRSSSPWGWDSSNNKNLRGGETGIVKILEEHIIFSSARLPDAYQEVEYIESTGTQYINTGYTPTVNTQIETDISWGTQSTEWAVFFGLTGNDRSSDGILGRIYSTTSTNFNPRFCNTNYDERQITNTSLNTFHNIILKSGSCSLDGTSYTITTNSTPYQSTIDIFAGNNGGSHGWRAGKCKIKTFKISIGGTLYRNLVPCYRKSDSVIGMYDLVNGVFYINSGSGTFTKGSDV